MISYPFCVFDLLPKRVHGMTDSSDSVSCRFSAMNNFLSARIFSRTIYMVSAGLSCANAGTANTASTTVTATAKRPVRILMYMVSSVWLDVPTGSGLKPGPPLRVYGVFDVNAGYAARPATRPFTLAMFRSVPLFLVSRQPKREARSLSQFALTPDGSA